MTFSKRIETSPNQAVEYNHKGCHEQCSGQQHGKVARCCCLGDTCAQTEGADGVLLELDILGDNAGIQAPPLAVSKPVTR